MTEREKGWLISFVGLIFIVGAARLAAAELLKQGEGGKVVYGLILGVVLFLVFRTLLRLHDGR